MRAQHWPIVVLLILPLAATAEQLTLGMQVSSGFSRRDRTGATGVGDHYNLRIVPSAHLEDQEGELQWDLRYGPSYQQEAPRDTQSGWDHQAQGKLDWQINPTTRLGVSDRLGRFQSVRRFNEVVIQGEGDDVVDVTDTGIREGWYINNAFGADLTHRLAPNRTLAFTLTHTLTDGDERLKRQTLSTSGRYMQAVSARSSLGGGVSFRRAQLDGSSTLESTSTDFYNVFGTWRYRFDETLALSVAGGPAWVTGGDQDKVVQVAENRLRFPILSIDGEYKLVKATSCPTLDDGTPFLSAGCDVIDENLTDLEVLALRSTVTDLQREGSVPSRGGSKLTYFANVALNKSWEQWSGALTYRRQESESSGVGTSTIADIVAGSLSWTPSGRWRTGLSVTWTRQSQATEAVRSVVAVRPTDIPLFGRIEGAAESFALRAVTVDQDIHIDTLALRFSARYRLTRRATLIGNVGYVDQSGSAGATRGYSDFSASFGVTFSFEPIRL